MISVAPTGNLIQGHVLDVSKRALEEKLRDYDHLLYVKWNPKKRGGWGSWEVRRRPENKSVVDIAEYEGHMWLRLEYKESDHINHVVDVPCLNYAIVGYLAERDTWKKIENIGNSRNMDYFVQRQDAQLAEFKEQQQAKILDDRKYALLQMKSQIAQLREAVLSGTNPHLIAHQMGQNKRR